MSSNYTYTRVGVDHPLVRASKLKTSGHSRAAIGLHRLVLYDHIGPGPHPCHWCSASVDWGRGVRPGVLVVDHLDGDGRNNDIANLVPSCNVCNGFRARATTRRNALIDDDELFIVNKDGTRARAVRIECQECGATFLAHASRVKRGTVKYCSLHCSGIVQARKRWGRV